MAINQTNGSLYVTSWPFAAIPNANLTNASQRFYISRFGKIGLGTDAPYADLHIIQRTSNSTGDEDVDMGITMEANQAYGGRPQWNIHVGRYYTNPFSSYDGFSFWHQLDNNGWFNVAGIGADGQYYQFSDGNLKKDITYV